MPKSAEAKTLTFRGAAGVASGDRRRDVDEELAQSDARRQHAEQHEVEDERRDDADRDPVDALARHVEVVD
jgi:phage terminase Nu1 subunit (DNA packaging protein)